MGVIGMFTEAITMIISSLFIVFLFGGVSYFLATCIVSDIRFKMFNKYQKKISSNTEKVLTAIATILVFIIILFLVICIKGR